MIIVSPNNFVIERKKYRQGPLQYPKQTLEKEKGHFVMRIDSTKT